MSNEMLIAFVGVGGTLLGTAVGFGLTYVSEYYKAKRTTEERKLTIEQEMQDASTILAKCEIGLKETIDFYCSGNELFTYAVPQYIRTPAYDDIFKHTLTTYRQNQRLNISDFYNAVFEYNETIKVVRSEATLRRSSFEKAQLLYAAYMLVGKALSCHKLIKENAPDYRINYDNEIFGLSETDTLILEKIKLRLQSSKQ
jgi:hypothetical protein